MNTAILDSVSRFDVTGRVTGVAGLELTVSGLNPPVGALLSVGLVMMAARRRTRRPA